MEVIYTQGVDVGEVARQQGRAPQTIYNQLNFIRRALAECVQRQVAGTAS